MRYKISEIARIFGVSTETIRYYEKIGLIKGARGQDNNYRYYDNWDIFDLGNYISYKNFNFTLEESRQALNSNNSSVLCNMLDNKICELDDQISRENILLEWMKVRAQDIKNTSLNLGRIIIQEYPEMLLTDTFRTMGDDHLNVNILSNLQPGLFNTYTLPILKTSITKIINADQDIERGCVCYKKYTDALGMELPAACTIIPKQTYITYAVEVEDLNQLSDIVRPLIDAAGQQRQEIKDELYGLFVTRLNVQDRHIRYIKFMIPITI